MPVPWIDQVKGFIAGDEGNALFELGKSMSPKGPCLEIGGYCGLSTIYIGSGVKENQGILYSVDHHQGSEEHQPGEEFHDPDLYDSRRDRVDSFYEFRKNISRANLEEVVVPIVAPSRIAARKWHIPLSLVFIDGGHSYEAAITDYRSWASHVLPGGILAIHDIFTDPANGGQAPYQIYQLALASGLFQEYDMVNTLGLLRRVCA
ncbi:MAG: class I SAM-dependent methyltransferase [Thermodesulfobacteriota bacterium]